MCLRVLKRSFLRVAKRSFLRVAKRPPDHWVRAVGDRNSGKIQYEITRKSRPHASSSLYTLIGREMKCIYIMKYEFEFVWTILKWSRHILDYTFRKKWDWNKREQGSLNDSWHSITNHRLKNNKGYQLLVEYVKTPHIWSWNLLGIFMTRTCCF